MTSYHLFLGGLEYRTNYKINTFDVDHECAIIVIETEQQIKLNDYTIMRS